MTQARQVPACETRSFRSKTSNYCVCVFVLNENGRLHAQLERMSPVSALADIVIADGNSTDGSTSSEALERLGVNTLLIKTGAGKLGAQMRMAFSWALERGYRGVITIDGNNKDDPAAVPLFLKALEEGADHVQGSRYIPGGVEENTPLSRYLGVRFLH